MTVLPKAAEVGVEAHWMDACWYGSQTEWSDWWGEVGSWSMDCKNFPNGLKPISDAARDAGMKFILWFEPERAYENSTLHREHPEFLLEVAEDHKDYTSKLFNLGMPEARRHITELFSEIITENGVDVYRQDFNFDPLPLLGASGFA